LARITQKSTLEPFFSGGWSVIRGLDERTFENSANKKGLWDECNSQTGNVKNIS